LEALFFDKQDYEGIYTWFDDLKEVKAEFDKNNPKK